MKITIQGREYAVEKLSNEQVPYKLTGARGAIYYASRNQVTPTHLFLTSAERMRVHPLGRIWLSDRSGKLEVA